MVAGAFRPKNKNNKTQFWGKYRDPEKRGKMVTGWDGATSTWVDVRAFIFGYDGNTYDITNDIVTGTLTRNTDAPTNLSITFTNDGDKYRQMFIPNDRIVLYLRRNEVEWTAFTGYIHNTPIFNLYSSRELTLDCSCIIRRLNQKFWEPNLRENIMVLSGGMPESTGFNRDSSILAGASDEEQDITESPVEYANAPIDPNGNIDFPERDKKLNNSPEEEDSDDMTTPDMTLAFLLTAPDHVGLKPEMVYIQKFPQAWAERAAEITAANQPCMYEWASMIVCPDDEPGDCEDDSESSSGSAAGLTIGEVVDQAGFPANRREEAIQMACCETGGKLDAGIENNTAAGQAAGGPVGLFQIVPTTAQGVDSSATVEKLKDPVYNATIARKIVENDGGWNQWACGPGVGNYYGSCNENDKIKNYTPNNNVRFANAPISPSGEISPQNPNNIEGDDDFNSTPSPCGSGAGSTENPGQSGSGNAPQGWHLVDTKNMELRVKINTKHASYVKKAMDNWDLGGVDIFESNTNPTVVVTDGPQPKKNVGATTYSDGRIVLGPAFNQSTSNAKEAMTTHEFGHALGFDHHPKDGTPDGSSVMQNATLNSNSNTTKPTSYDQNLYAETWGTGGGISKGSGESNVNIYKDNIDKFRDIAREMYRSPYRWGGGHNEELSKAQAIKYGTDTSGFFNFLRRSVGLAPWDIGGTVDYFKFLENVQEFDPREWYAPGTILINPGSRNVMGHMAMVYDEKQHVIEMNGRKGGYDSYTVQESNSNWSGYTHVGVMPDLGLKDPEPYIKGVPRWPRPDVNDFDACGLEPEEPAIQSEGTYTIQLGATHHNVEPYIKEKADEIKNKFNVSWNTYVGHGEPGGSWEEVTFDVWGPGGRGDPIGHSVGEQVKNYVLDNFTDGLMYMIWDAWMYGPGRNYAWKQDPHYDHVHVSFGYKGKGDVGGQGPDGGADQGSGSGDDTGEAYVDLEHCITKHPAGVYKLAKIAIAEMQGESSMLAEHKRSLALSGGSMSNSLEVLTQLFDENAFQHYPELWEETTEQRNWEHIAELDKEPYMATIQDVSDYGMYTMMSIGTGEIVFWYPWIVGQYADYVMNENKGDKLTKEDAQRLYKRYPRLKAYVLEGKTWDHIAQRFPDLNLGKKASEEIEEKKDVSGLPLGASNVSVLTSKMLLRDSDLVDFSLYISDDPLVTHYFVLGEYRLEAGTMGGIQDLQCYRWSTIFDNPLLVKQANENPQDWDPNAFIQRYGVRSKSEQVRSIKIPGMAQIWAEQQFIRQWLNCYLIQLSTSFLPELYPGQRLEIESLGIEVVILQVTHTFGSSWNTSLTVSQPITLKDSTKIPPLPFWTLFDSEMVSEGLDPTRPVAGIQNSNEEFSDGSIPIDVADLGTGEDLWENIEEKIKEDNARVEDYLKYWAQLRDNPELRRRTEQFYEENPGMARPPGRIPEEWLDYETEPLPDNPQQGIPQDIIDNLEGGQLP